MGICGPVRTILLLDMEYQLQGILVWVIERLNTLEPFEADSDQCAEFLVCAYILEYEFTCCTPCSVIDIRIPMPRYLWSKIHLCCFFGAVLI
jgi:hypothetical protein